MLQKSILYYLFQKHKIRQS